MVASLPNGEVLTSGATLTLPATDWAATQGLGSDRPLDAPYVVLADGRLVTSGGGGQSMRTYYDVELSARVDIFDPVSNSWKPGRSLDAMRSQHTMTLLPTARSSSSGAEGPIR